jgi:hypothetical protein
MWEQPTTSITIGPGSVDLGVLGSVCAQTWKELVSDPRRSSAEVSEEILQLLDAGHEELEAEFSKLTAEWKAERTATSSTAEIVIHPAYQRIIGMGMPAVPLILRELNTELDHWFWALKAISGEDPIPAEHLGKMKQMAEDWLEWGRTKGYVR